MDISLEFERGGLSNKNESFISHMTQCTQVMTSLLIHAGRWLYTVATRGGLLFVQKQTTL
jgi:hypothetical protein